MGKNWGLLPWLLLKEGWHSNISVGSPFHSPPTPAASKCWFRVRLLFRQLLESQQVAWLEDRGSRTVEALPRMRKRSTSLHLCAPCQQLKVSYAAGCRILQMLEAISCSNSKSRFSLFWRLWRSMAHQGPKVPRYRYKARASERRKLGSGTSGALLSSPRRNSRRAELQPIRACQSGSSSRQGFSPPRGERSNPPPIPR